MIDELAKAIDEASIAWSKENHGLSKWDVPSDLIARALLRRLREPTPEMKAAAVQELSDTTVQAPKASAWDALRAYKAMIDAALGERGA